MFVDQSSRPRKRQFRDCDRARVQDWERNDCKRQKRVDSTTVQPSSAFWDNLSEVHLTRAALQELHRRNSANHPRPHEPTNLSRCHRPFTRSLARLDKSLQATVPADTYTQKCSTRTASDLRRFARRGGPNMTGERGHAKPSGVSRPAKSSRQPTSQPPRQNPTPTPSDHTSAETSSSRNTGPYNRNFQQHLIDHSVFPNGYEYPDGLAPPLPSNWDVINERLRTSRASLSPSRFTEEDFRRFKKADAHAFKEKQVTTSVIPVIEGAIRDARCTSGGIPFRNFDPLTDGTIVPGNPDVYYGARPEQLDRRVRRELSGVIEPSTQDDLPIVPNFTVAAKGPDGSLAVALRQASYDGALNARGIHTLQRYGQTRPVPKNEASTIASIYHGGTLKLYTSHRNESADPDSRPKYYMHQLRSFAMTDSSDTFRQGAMAYRNARDWAEEQRDRAIEAANTVISGLPGEIGHATPTASTWTESERSRLELVEESQSPESTQYTTPPGGEQTIEATLHFEQFANSDTNKRSRQHLQGSSPLQQKKRHRQEQLDNSPSPESSTAATATSTGLSYRLEDHGLDPEEDGLDNQTEVLSSDEEAINRPIEKGGSTKNESL